MQSGRNPPDTNYTWWLIEKSEEHTVTKSSTKLYNLSFLEGFYNKSTSFREERLSKRCHVFLNYINYLLTGGILCDSDHPL